MAAVLARLLLGEGVSALSTLAIVVALGDVGGWSGQQHPTHSGSRAIMAELVAA
jgi:hypothetical protein